MHKRRTTSWKASSSECPPISCEHALTSGWRPLGFDMEWLVKYKREPGPDGKTTVVDRPTAVIQLCDTKMILVVQISALDGELCVMCSRL